MAGLPITIFDVAVGAIILVSALLSLSRGFVREAFSLLSWIAAGFVAWTAYPAVRPLMQEALGGGFLADAITALLVFLVPLVALKLIGGMFVRGLQGVGLGGADKALGLVYGVARGGLIVSIAYLLASMLIEASRFPVGVRDAALQPPVKAGADLIAGLLPSETRERGRARLETTVEGALESAERGRGASEAPPRQPESGYTEDQRRGLDRLIETVR
jgi:membrane protein required for colicin V production